MHAHRYHVSLTVSLIPLSIGAITYQSFTVVVTVDLDLFPRLASDMSAVTR